MQKKQNNSGFLRRIIAMVVLVSILLGIFIWRLAQFQLVDGDAYYAQAAKTITYTFPITAARGEILDRNGKAVATNTTGFSLVLNRLFLPSNQLNETLAQLINLLEKTGENWVDNTPLTKFPPYDFTEKNPDGTDGSKARAMKKAFGKQEYATAAQVMDGAIKQFSLEEYPPEMQRKLIGLRYEMVSSGYSDSTPFIFARDVSSTTVAVVMEQHRLYPGVEVQEVSKRVYPEGTLMPHILGRMGLISEEEWQANDFALSKAGYEKDEMIGKFGLEQAFENVLRGTDGIMEIVRQPDGTLVESRVVKPPQPGNSIVLTIDSNFQRQLQQHLEDFIHRLRDNKDPKLGGSAEGGSVVVLDVKTGGILGYANYPSYDVNDYFSDYQNLAQQELNPLYNRAFMGLYRPGSAFKPVVALSGLLNGEIDAGSTVFCSGTYGYFAPGYTPKCLGVHGNYSVRPSLQHSCNIFYYDVGRRLGHEVYNETAKALGLGVSTGVEVAENAGRLSSVASSLELGMEWNPADDSQAAIGQLNTAVTPLQMAVMASTLANQGTRYQTHLLDSIVDFSTRQTVSRFTPVPLTVLPDENNAFELVREGMILAARDGSSGNFLGEDSPVVVASKTGSPQEADLFITNATTISYAPADQPEIALAVVVEKGVNGYRCAELVRAVIDTYFK